MPCDYSKYPKNWKTEIRPTILERADHKCEECGVENYSNGARDRFGNWHTESEINNMKSDTGDYYFEDFPKFIRIILTIAHMNHDISDNRLENLKAMCQKCHLNFDKHLHASNSRATRERKSGQQKLAF